jgi:SAM-dependent methyltransferase
MALEPILEAVERYYTGRLLQHGPTPAGVDWNGEASQKMRFAQLLRALEPLPGAPLSVLDFGCGYGALVPFLESREVAFTYYGFDISPEMIAEARRTWRGRTFSTDLSALPAADVVVASGIFNVRLEAHEDAWKAHVQKTLRLIHERASRAWAANFLTAYSDPEKMRPDLHYADPGLLMDFVKRNLSRHVSVLHDYGLYEFTLSARKEPWGAP